MRSPAVQPAGDPPLPTLHPAFAALIELGPIQDLGTTRAGHRRVVPIVGGTLSDGLSGEILPGGADWQVVRADGSVEVDGRYCARLEDEALLYIHAVGIRSGDPELLDSLLQGADVPADSYYFRASVTIECASRPELEHSLFVASYVREASCLRYVAYRVG